PPARRLRGGRVVPHTPKGQRPAEQRPPRRQYQHNAKHQQRRRRRHAKNLRPEQSRQGQSQPIANPTADQSQQQLFRRQQKSHRRRTRSQRFHQSNFCPPLNHRSRRGRPHRQRRREQRRRRHQPQKRPHTHQNFSFPVGHAVNHPNL